MAEAEHRQIKTKMMATLDFAVKRDLVFVDRVRDTARHRLLLWLVTGGFRIWVLGELCCCAVTVVVLQSCLCFSIIEKIEKISQESVIKHFHKLTWN